MHQMILVMIQKCIMVMSAKQEEVFGYILEKYPRLQNIPYVNPGLNPTFGNRYFDARNLIAANSQEIVDTAFNDMITTYSQ